eukprot:TRINITY_DN47809_c0_g1_i1.p1 TRINITY_DN47809_c0_g1~~TRINITY_DN47809_c0_g1_i1.p1  ORF type:complete len:519 (-),score=127.45 TRINITY_DN47809_c0_g1_i1:136-1692(-)
MDLLSPIGDFPPHQRTSVFLRKLKHCESSADLSTPTLRLPSSEVKQRFLIDIATYISSQRNVINDTTCKPFLRMISANIMRTLPVAPSTNHNVYEPDGDEPFLDPSWAQLQIVYELLRRFLISADMECKAARACISDTFVTRLVELFNSQDAREREALKTILHRIYGKMMTLRACIRLAITNVFHRVVYDNARFHGVAELLEILGSIINGFAVPLKEEHKQLLRKALLPLHLPNSMAQYHVQLCFCVTQFAEKEPALCREIVSFLLKHWPAMHSRKEVMMLNEMEELLELAPPEDMRHVISPLFRRIGRCIESAHFQVAERALFYWNNEYVVSVMMQFRHEVMEAVFGSLSRNVSSHWNANVLSLSCNVQQLLAEMDAKLFERCRVQYEKERAEEQRRAAERDVRWRQVYRLAKLRGGGAGGGDGGGGGSSESGRRSDAPERNKEEAAVLPEASSAGGNSAASANGACDADDEVGDGGGGNARAERMDSGGRAGGQRTGAAGRGALAASAAMGATLYM